MNDLFSEIIEKLSSLEYFSDFKFRKRDFRLIKKNVNGYEVVEFQFWVEKNQSTLVVKPLYLKRFDVLHKWFEKFSFKTLVDQRDNYSIGFDGNMLGKRNEFSFLLDKENFESDFDNFQKELINNCKVVFGKFLSAKDLYLYLIEPILQNKNPELPNVGADWVFEYLTLARIENRKAYEDLKSIIKKQVQVLNASGEPNIVEYYPKFDEIIDFLEQQKFS